MIGWKHAGFNAFSPAGALMMLFASALLLLPAQCGETKVLYAHHYPRDAAKLADTNGMVLGDEVTLLGAEITDEAKVSLFQADHSHRLEIEVSGKGGAYLVDDEQLLMPKQEPQASSLILTMPSGRAVTLILFLRKPNISQSQLEQSLKGLKNRFGGVINEYSVMRTNVGMFTRVIPLKITARKAEAMPDSSKESHSLSDGESLYSGDDRLARFQLAWQSHDSEKMVEILEEATVTEKELKTLLFKEKFAMASVLDSKQWRCLLHIHRKDYRAESLPKLWLQLLTFFLAPNYSRGKQTAKAGYPMILHFIQTMIEFSDIQIDAAFHAHFFEVVSQSKTRDKAAIYRTWLQIYGKDDELCESVWKESSLVQTLPWADGSMCGWRILEGAVDRHCRLPLDAWDDLLRVQGKLEEIALNASLWRMIIKDHVNEEEFISPLGLIQYSMQHGLNSLLIVSLALYHQREYLSQYMEGLVQSELLSSLQQLLIVLKYCRPQDQVFLDRVGELSPAHAFVIAFYRQYRNYMHSEMISCRHQELPSVEIDMEALERMMQPLFPLRPGSNDPWSIVDGFHIVPSTIAYLLTGMSLNHCERMTTAEGFGRGDAVAVVNLRNQHYCRVRAMKPVRTLLAFEIEWERAKKEDIMKKNEEGLMKQGKRMMQKDESMRGFPIPRERTADESAKEA